jgi:hypothetical protein
MNDFLCRAIFCLNFLDYLLRSNGPEKVDEDRAKEVMVKKIDGEGNTSQEKEWFAREKILKGWLVHD